LKYKQEKMNKYFLRFAIVLLITSASIGTISAQNRDRDERRESIRHRRSIPAAPQPVTSRVESIAPPQVVNWQQIADSEAAHPRPSRTGFITQIEDKDADFKFQPHIIPAGTPTFDPDQLPGVRPRSANSPQHQRDSPAPLGYFLGTAGNGSLVPPDVAGAAGSTYVVETNNQQFDIYTKAGVHQSTVNLDNFFTGGTTGGYFDPHIVYDNINGHFIIVIDGNISTNNDGGLFIAVSQTSDPTGSWWTYKIDNGDANTNDLLDYPQIGYNKNWFVITDNDFVGNNTTEDIYIMSIASLESGTLGTVTHKTDANSFSIAPAQTMDNTTNTLWLVQDGNGANGAMQIGSITGTVAAPVYNAGSNVAVTSHWNETSVDVEQLGGGTTQLINDDDTRVGNGCVFTNGQLWFTHAVWLPATGTATNSAVDWWEVNPSALTVTQFGRIAAPTNGATVTNYYYPTINVNSNGDALLGYCVSGADSFYASAAYSFHAGTDPVNSMQSRYIYKPGATTYYQTLGGTRNRYGDYTGTMVDPSDQSFWNFSEWAYTSTYWGTVIAHVAAATPPTSPPVASFSASSTALTCDGFVQFTDESTNTPTSWLWNFGDGTTSTLQDPSHQYTTNGTYTVSLKATNAYGNNTSTLTNYITVNLPAGPTAANVSSCGSSTFALTANTSNKLGWFDSTGTFLSAANPYTTPVLTASKTYYVQDTVPNAIDSVGPKAYNTLGTGGTFTATNQHYLVFDALNSFTLISVVVDASTAGARTIQLINSGGTVIATATPTIPAGVSTVALNFSVPAGTGYELSCSGTVNMYRNNAVAAGAYPFTLANIASITSSDAGTGYYYYFYNWKVQAAPCVSERTPVRATVYPGGLTPTPVPTAVACYGGTTGAVTVTGTGGTPSYTYTWSNSQTGTGITGLAAGTYTVTIKDANGCTATAASTVSQPSAALTATDVVTNVGCSGGNTGSIAVTPAGGTSGYTYVWSTTPTQTTATATALATGTYTVTVKDAHSCSTTLSAIVSTSGSSLVLSTTPGNATCGSSNGTAAVNVTTGTGTYTYHWSNNGTTASISGLAAGTYTVTVSSSGGCSATASVQISSTGGPALTPSATSTTCGQSNGTASVSASGGTPGYTYLWSNSATTPSLSNLSSGTYTVTVKDANGCASISSVTVSPSNGVTASGSSTATTCGLSNGSASVSVTNPSSPTYHWSNNGSTAQITGLTSGSYTVTVTNAGCSATASVSVAASSAPSLSSTSGATTCGNSNGTASVSVANPVNPSYSWSNSGNTAQITGLSSGTYTVTVTSNGCTATTSVSVAGSTPISLTPAATATTCGGINGSASVSVSNPNNPTYLWSNNAATSTISNIGSGAYTVTVTNNGCSATASVSVGASSGVALSTSSADAVCAQVNGSASVSVATPVSPTYIWSNGGTGSSISGLAAGTYTVTVNDNGCSATASVSVGQSAGTLAVSATPTAEPCFGDALATATASASGGSPSYTYSWSNSVSGPSVTGLTAGIYVVSVTDNNGCSSTYTVRITQPNPIRVVTGTTNISHTQLTGTASIDSVTGGTKPYTISWSNGETGTADTGLAPGTYIATVVDSNGCKTTDTVTIINTVLGIAPIQGGLNFSIYPNPAKTEVVIDLLNNYANAAISLKDILGQTLLSQSLTSAQVTLDLTPFTEGVYFIELTQAGKQTVKKLVISGR
jgi:PKD repeat protein